MKELLKIAQKAWDDMNRENLIPEELRDQFPRPEELEDILKIFRKNAHKGNIIIDLILLALFDWQENSRELIIEELKNLKTDL